MTKENQTPKIPAFFDKNPELKAKLIAALGKGISETQKQKNIEAVYKFINGELTWAEIKNIPPRLLKSLAKFGFEKYKNNDLSGAIKIFKGLALIDHANWYYRMALGAIFQKQKNFEDAIEEYSVAIELNENEASLFLNRAQCHMQLEEFDLALEDLTEIDKLNSDDKGLWQKKAKALKTAILSLQS